MTTIDIATKQPETWWRELCWVTDQICVTGDLSGDRLEALNQLEAQRQLPGIVEVTQRSLWSRLFEEG